MTDASRDSKGRFLEGNLIALGNKGGGRKSAYEEIGKARLLEKAFFESMDEDAALQILCRVNEIQKAAMTKYKKIKNTPGQKKGGLSLFQVALAQALSGNEAMMKLFIKKVFPDRVLDETPQGESPASEIIKALMMRSKGKKKLPLKKTKKKSKPKSK